LENNDTTAQDIRNEMKVLVLLSGGMDSTTILAYTKTKHEEVEALTFDYGHKHRQELDNAQRVADYYNTKLTRFDFDFAKHFNKSTIIYAGEKHLSDDYMPFRNMIIFAVACGYAQAHGFEKIYYGANADDIFPDNLEPFLIQYNKAVESMQTKIKIEYPFMKLDKKGIVEKAIELNVPLRLTRSCYEAGDKSCGKCVACKKRLHGFKQAGVSDEIDYC